MGLNQRNNIETKAQMFQDCTSQHVRHVAYDYGQELDSQAHSIPSMMELSLMLFSSSTCNAADYSHIIMLYLAVCIWLGSYQEHRYSRIYSTLSSHGAHQTSIPAPFSRNDYIVRDIHSQIHLGKVSICQSKANIYLLALLINYYQR